MRPGAHNLGNQIRDGLEPCPFCGGEASFGTIEYNEAGAREVGDGKQRIYHCVNCTRCSANNRGIVGHATCEDAAARWNARVTSEANQSSLDTMGGRIEELAEIVEVVAARKTIRESLIGIVGERRLPQQGASDTDKLILRARAALKLGPVSRSHASHQAPAGLGRSGFDRGQSK